MLHLSPASAQGFVELLANEVAQQPSSLQQVLKQSCKSRKLLTFTFL